MAQQKSTDVLKILGAIVLFAASIGLFIHRMPNRQYVQVHADKPRPAANAAVAAAPAAPRAAPKPEKQQPAAPKPKAPEAVAAVASVASSAPTTEWRDACLAESGILCYQTPAPRLRRCLREYEDVLRKDCRAALNFARGDAQ